MATVWLLKQTSNRRSVAGCRLQFLAWWTHKYLKIIGHVTVKLYVTVATHCMKCLCIILHHSPQLCVWAEAEPLRLTVSELRLQLNCRTQTLQTPRRPPTSSTEWVYFCNVKWTVRGKKTSCNERVCIWICLCVRSFFFIIIILDTRKLVCLYEWPNWSALWPQPSCSAPSHHCANSYCMTSDPLCLLGLLNVEGCELHRS